MGIQTVSLPDLKSPVLAHAMESSGSVKSSLATACDLYLMCDPTDCGIIAKLKKRDAVNREFLVLVVFVYSINQTVFEQQMSGNVFMLQIAECENRNAKSRESRSFYIFKRYLNKILNEARKLGLVSI